MAAFKVPQMGVSCSSLSTAVFDKMAAGVTSALQLVWCVKREGQVKVCPGLVSQY